MRAEDSLNLRKPLQAETDTSSGLSDKLHAAAYVIGGGVKDGLKGCWTEIKEHPLRAGLTVLGAAGVGGALAAAQRSTGVVALGAQIAGASFTVGLARDVVGRAGVTFGAVNDSLKGTGNLDANRRVVAQTVGPFALDFGLMTLGGALGAGSVRGVQTLASRSRFTPEIFPVSQGPETAPGVVRPAADKSFELYDAKTIESAAGAATKEIYWDAWPSVIKIRASKSTGEHTGTGFFLTESGEAATNFHVVANASRINVITADGSQYRATVTEVNPRADLALLKIMQPLSAETPKRVKFDPLPLAEKGVASTSNLYSFGHNPAHQDLTVAVGRFSRQVDGTVHIKNMPAPLDPSQPVMETKMLTKPGFSGGPLLNERREVIGVNFASDSQGVSYAIPLQSLRELIRSRQQRFGTVPYSVDAVPLISKNGGLAADRTEFTSDFSGVYSSIRPSVFKIGGAAEGKSPIAASAFAVGDRGFFVTSADAVRNLKWIALNEKGMWQVPLELKGEFGGLALLQAGRGVEAPNMVPQISKGSLLVPGQRLIAMGYPSTSLEVHASLGSYRGVETSGRKGDTDRILRSKLSGESGLAGAPVVTKHGNIVGVLKSNNGDSSQIIALNQRHPLLVELNRLQGK